MGNDFNPNDYGTDETVEVNARNLALLLNEVWDEIGYHNLEYEDEVQELRESLK